MTDPGRLIAGRYRLGERIGNGAMGVVWQALDERLHRTVAVKQLLLAPGLSATQAEEARNRAMREGRIAARLQHGNAISVYDVTEDGGQPWLIMEYLPSRSLADVFDTDGPMPPEQAARIGAQVADALAAAHAAGIVHRDIKPANVLIAGDGTVKITDFGISRAVGDVTVTATGMLAGTPAYLAPEMARGGQPAPASDVFSLGATLYAAVEGHPPFGTNENQLALLHTVAAGQLQPPRRAGALTPVLAELLQIDPARRPTMVQARDALHAVAAGQAVGMPTPPQAPPHKPTLVAPVPPAGTAPPQVSPTAATANPEGWPRRRRVLVGAGAIVAAATVGILVANALMGSGDAGAMSAPTPTSTPSQQSAPAAVTTTEAAPTTTPPTVTPARAEQAISTYYGLLPAHRAVAWRMLTAAQQQQSGGWAQYRDFWESIEKVSVVQMSPQGAGAVLVTLRFTTASEKRTQDRYAIAVVDDDGQLKIAAARLVDSTPVDNDDHHGDDDTKHHRHHRHHDDN